MFEEAQAPKRKGVTTVFDTDESEVLEDFLEGVGEVGTCIVCHCGEDDFQKG